MNKTGLIVYKASAGSGKTFTLTVQYIKMLILPENNTSFRNILAVTFTNKATAEMKDRILQQLYGIWKGLPSSQGYVEALHRELQQDKVNISDKDIRQKAGYALQSILHDYSHFRVETIDSFFQSVLKTLAHELNLTANLQVDLNDKEVLNKAVDQIMDELALRPQVMKWIQEYVNDRIQNNEKWDISKEIKMFATWIFKEAYLKNSDKLVQLLSDNQFMDQFRKEMKELIEASKDQLASLAIHFSEEMESYEINGQPLTYTDFSRGSSLGTYIKKLKDKDLLNAEFKATLQKYVADPMNMLTKANKKNEVLCDAARHFSQLLLEIHEFQERCVPVYATALLASEFLNPLRLLGVIDEQVTAINTETNRFLLAKTPILLHRLIDESDAPFIFEKMGTTFQHVMIDEFQDTSTMQWHNFKILLMDKLAEGNSNLLVGDVKQSIYRWRNSDWTILNHIDKEMASQNPDIRQLETNYRSDRRIINFNNHFFQNAAYCIDRLVPDARIKLEEAYGDVSQKCPDQKPQEGYVRIQFYQEDKKAETEWEEEMLDDICEQVRLLAEKGIPYSEMAILIRKRKQAQPIIARFAEKMPHVRLVSDEAFLLSSSCCIQMLIAAMTYLVQPENDIALNFLIQHYHQDVLQETDDIHQRWLREEKTSLLPQEFIAQQEQLRLMPLYELQETLFRLFQLDRLSHQDAYLFAYFDALISYLEDNPSDIQTFLNYWEEELADKSIPSGEVDGIRIFTIHKSKGLQFHTVLIPYCHWELERDKTGSMQKNDLLWCSPSCEPFNKLPLIPICIKKNMQQSLFRAEYEEEHLQRRVDSLNTLYVAFTRAEKNLLVWCKSQYKWNQSAGMGELLSEALPYNMEEVNCTYMSAEDEKDADKGNIELFEYGQPQDYQKKTKKGSDNRMEMEAAMLPVAMQSYEAQIDFRQSNQSAQFINSLQDEEEDVQETYIQQGKLLHYIFARIKTIEDVESSLNDLESNGLIAHTQQREQLKKWVIQGLQQKEVASWFDGSWQLYNECSILYRAQDEDEYIVRRPDRVMISDQEIIVVDFKFGRVKEEYQDQVRQYMQLLQDMQPEKRIKGFLWYVYSNRIEEINMK